MASAMEQTDVGLERAISEVERQIEERTMELREWEQKQQGTGSALADLKAEHAEACEQQVLGKGSSGTVSKIKAQIDDLEIKLVGITRVVASKQSALSELRGEIAQLHVQQAERVKVRRIEEEAQLTAQRIAQAERALTDKVQAEKVFVETVLALREHKYLGEPSRRQAMDSAQSLSRRFNGMRP